MKKSILGFLLTIRVESRWLFRHLLWVITFKCSVCRGVFDSLDEMTSDLLAGTVYASCNSAESRFVAISGEVCGLLLDFWCNLRGLYFDFIKFETKMILMPCILAQGGLFVHYGINRGSGVALLCTGQNH